MWVYQKPESSEPLEPLSAPSVPDSTPLKTKVTLPEPNEPFPAEGPSQAVPAVPELMETPRKRSLRADHSCILLAGAYLFGLLCAAPVSWKRSTIISAAGGLPLQRKRRLRQWAFSGRNF